MNQKYTCSKGRWLVALGSAPPLLLGPCPVLPCTCSEEGARLRLERCRKRATRTRVTWRSDRKRSGTMERESTSQTFTQCAIYMWTVKFCNYSVTVVLGCMMFYCADSFSQTLRSPRERWQSLGKRSGEVGGGFEGNCVPVAAAFMLPFLGKAAAGGRGVRGNRHASEDGPVRDGARKREEDWS